MRGLSSVLGLILMVTLLSFPSSVRAGDPELAGFMYRKGKKASRSKNFEEAAGFYRKAMREHSPYPEACYGLGRALEKLGRTREAIRAYRRCCNEVGELDQPSSRQSRLLMTAKKAIGKLSEGYSRLAKLEAQFVKGCVAFGRKNFTTDPTWARKAFGSALILDPSHKTALAQIARLNPKAEVRKTTVTYATANRMSDWQLAEHPSLWSCTRTAIRVDRPGTSVSGWWKLKLTGRYTVSATLQIEKVYADEWYVGVLFASHFYPMRLHAIVVMNPNDYQLTWRNVAIVKLVTNGQLFNWEKSKPLQVRIEVDHSKVRILLAGKEVDAREYDEEIRYQGMVGICVQQASLKVTDMKVER